MSTTKAERDEITDKIERLETELAKARQVLSAMDVLAEYHASRNGGKQQDLLPLGTFEGLTPTKTILAVLASNPNKWWIMKEIMEAARQGGNNVDRYPNPRNNFGVAINRMAKAETLRRIYLKGKTNYRCISSKST